MAKGSGLPKMTQSGGKYPASGSGMGGGRAVSQKSRDFKGKTSSQAPGMTSHPMPTNKRSGK